MDKSKQGAGDPLARSERGYPGGRGQDLAQDRMGDSPWASDLLTLGEKLLSSSYGVDFYWHLRDIEMLSNYVPYALLVALLVRRKGMGNDESSIFDRFSHDELIVLAEARNRLLKNGDLFEEHKRVLAKMKRLYYQETDRFRRNGYQPTQRESQQLSRAQTILMAYRANCGEQALLWHGILRHLSDDELSMLGEAVESDGLSLTTPMQSQALAKVEAGVEGLSSCLRRILILEWDDLDEYYLEE